MGVVISILALIQLRHFIMSVLVSKAEIEKFNQDGAVFLKGKFDINITMSLSYLTDRSSELKGKVHLEY